MKFSFKGLKKTQTLHSSPDKLRNLISDISDPRKAVKPFKISSKSGISPQSASVRSMEQTDRLQEIQQQFLNQHLFSVRLGSLGTQSARYCYIRVNTQPDAPTVFLIGGISNDIDPMASLAQEVALSGTNIIVMGYPESVQGSVTEQFVKAVEASDSFEHHALFFSKAINRLLRSSAAELWGYSTGAPIIATVLLRSAIQNRIKKAVFICPAASHTQTKMQLFTGVAHEAGQGMKFFGLLPSYSLVLPRQYVSDTLKKRVYNSLLDKICIRTEAFSDCRVRKNGRIVVISASQDQITKSFLDEDLFLGNPQAILIRLDKMNHLSPVIDAENTVKIIQSV